MASPPEGYSFVLRKNLYDLVLSRAIGSDFILFGLLFPVLRHSGGRGEMRVPVNMWYRNLPAAAIPIVGRKCDLVYSWNHVPSGKSPWVLDHEYLFSLTGYNIAAALRFSPVIERELRDEKCRSIICPTNLSHRLLTKSFGMSSLKSKAVVINRAVRPRVRGQIESKDKLTLIFIGTMNEPGAFHTKGGKEAVEAFKRLRKKRNDVRLVVRSDVPPYLRKDYNQVDGLTIVDRALSRGEFDFLLSESSLAVLPMHTTPTSAFLDAMGCGIPVMTTDEMANGELVEHGKTGIVVPAPRSLPTIEEMVADPTKVRRWEKMVLGTHWDVVESLASSIESILEHRNEVKMMGALSRQEVSHGRFSVGFRNSKMSRLFDSAI